MAHKKNKNKNPEAFGSSSIHRSVVVSDGHTKRAKERSLYSRRCKELKQTSRRLQDFEDIDKPEFRMWLEAELGEFMDICQQAATELSDLSHLIDLVKEYAYFKRMPQRDAYAIVKAARENGSELTFRDDEEGDSGAPGSPGYDSDSEEDDLKRVFSEFFEAFTGESSEGAPFGSADQDDAFSGHRTRQHENRQTGFHADGQTPQEYLKVVYRQLVRLLHPDINAEVSQDKADLWHEVQSAYGWGDIQRLELILKKVTGDDSKSLDLKVIPISHIMDLRRDVEKRLRIFKNRIAAARQELAWEFRSLKKNKKRLAAMKSSLKYELDSEHREIKSKISGYKRQITNWEKSRPEKNKKSPRTKMSHSTVASYLDNAAKVVRSPVMDE